MRYLLIFKAVARKFAESGGAILLERNIKFFFGKKLKSYGVPLK